MAETDWKINKTAPQCHHCGVPFEPEQAFFSVLFQTSEGLQRNDFCDNCFQNYRPPDVVYFWKTMLPKAGGSGKKQRPVLDMEYVLEFFKRLEGDSSIQRVAFRYILALMLSRKKILTAGEKKKDDQGHVVQNYREKMAGAETVNHAVIEPDLNETEIQALSAELSVLLGMAPTPEASDVPETAAQELTQPAGAECVENS